MRPYPIYLWIVFAGLVLSACDKIEEPFIEPGHPITSNRKVLLEEYTGHKCPNCPAGSQIAHDLKELYQGKLVLVSIHTGFFANPDASGHYIADFRTEAGNELLEEYHVQSFPSGMVNRTAFDDNFVLSKDAWASAVNELMEQPEQALLTIDHTYTVADRRLDIVVQTEVVSEIANPVSLCVYITGDTIAPQVNNNPDLGPSPDWEDYHHQDMLVEAIGGTFGHPVNENQPVVVGEVYSNTFSSTLKEGWPAHRCSIVAFIYDHNTKAVIQAEEVSIAE